jgi:hypothetical protein
MIKQARKTVFLTENYSAEMKQFVREQLKLFLHPTHTLPLQHHNS